MKIRILLLFAVLCSAVFAPAQIGYSQKTNEILGKINWLDMSKWILPILADKKQLNDLLIGLEKAQAKETQIRKLDEKELLAVEKEVTEALDGAVLRSDYPSKELTIKIAKLTNALMIRQTVAFNEIVTDMYAICTKTLQVGQLKAISNLINPKDFEPSLKVESWTEEDRIKYFIRRILLDRTAYEFLRLLYKQAK